MAVVTFWIGFATGLIAAGAILALACAIALGRIARKLPYPPPEAWR